jgi:hypothetical protein
VVGAGGYVGAMGRSLLEAHFAQTGAYIFAISVLLAGLLLSTDYFMFRAAAVTTSVTGRTLMQVGHLGHVSTTRRTLRRSSRKRTTSARYESARPTTNWMTTTRQAAW